MSEDSSMNDCLRKLREEQVSQFRSNKLDRETSVKSLSPDPDTLSVNML